MIPVKRCFKIFLVFLAWPAMACDKADPKDLPEWTPADHDNQGSPQPAQAAEQQPQQVDPKQPRAGMPNLEQFGITDLVLASWKQSCVPCHGVIGRGDGPQGAAFQPRDLTDPSWQRVAIDSEIIHTITKGRGRMPAFPDLPDETVKGLVRLVRLLNADPGAKAKILGPAAGTPRDQEKVSQPEAQSGQKP